MEKLVRNLDNLKCNKKLKKNYQRIFLFLSRFISFPEQDIKKLKISFIIRSYFFLKIAS